MARLICLLGDVLKKRMSLIHILPFHDKVSLYVVYIVYCYDLQTNSFHKELATGITQGRTWSLFGTLFQVSSHYMWAS